MTNQDYFIASAPETLKDLAREIVATTPDDASNAIKTFPRSSKDSSFEKYTGIRVDVLAAVAYVVEHDMCPPGKEHMLDILDWYEELPGGKIAITLSKCYVVDR